MYVSAADQEEFDSGSGEATPEDGAEHYLDAEDIDEDGHSANDAGALMDKGSKGEFERVAPVCGDGHKGVILGATH